MNLTTTPTHTTFSPTFIPSMTPIKNPTLTPTASPSFEFVQDNAIDPELIPYYTMVFSFTSINDLVIDPLEISVKQALEQFDVHFSDYTDT